MKRTVVFDFDGVVHSYKSGWCGLSAIPDPPVEGIKEVIDELRALGYEVCIVSTRCSTSLGRDAIRNWLITNGIEVDKIQADKPPAVCYVDDRALRFEGHTVGLVDAIKNFKSWTET